jgi:hypothetical protein
MADTVGGRLKHAWNAFTNRVEDKQPIGGYGSGATYGYRPDRVRYRTSHDRSIISAIYTRLVIDIASVGLYHIRRDEEKRYTGDMRSGLNNCFTLEANLDQSAFDFKIDMVYSLFDEGYIAIVPIETDIDPTESGGYDIRTMRVGSITQWAPKEVTVSLYNEETGRREELRLPKRMVAIVTNPLYQVMNEPNSTFQRLVRKLNLMDGVDEQSASGKLDLIIQLPYTIKSEMRRQQAEQRRKDIEFQLQGSKYGIAYTEGTEKITQLNRSAENNLLKQIEYLTDQLYIQLGITKTVMDGTADEKEMLNYMDRTVEPVLEAFANEFRRKFLTPTGRSQGQWIDYYKDPFKLVPMSSLAEIADKLTRNEIVSSNEFRQFIGLKPSKDPKADELRNSNMPEPLDPATTNPSSASTEGVPSDDDIMNDAFDEIDKALDESLRDLDIDDDDEDEDSDDES